MTAVAFALAAYIPLALLRGWVLSLLWGWYVVDYFGMRALSVVEAVGLSLLVGLLTAGFPPADDRPVWFGAAYSALISLTVLAFGWLWSLFL